MALPLSLPSSQHPQTKLLHALKAYLEAGKVPLPEGCAAGDTRAVLLEVKARLRDMLSVLRPEKFIEEKKRKKKEKAVEEERVVRGPCEQS